jgi:hypothetical protein
MSGFLAHTMKKIIIGLVMVSVSVSTMVMGNTNSPHILWATDCVPSLANTNIAFTLYPVVTNGLRKEMPQVSSYCVVVTNFTKEYKTIGNRATGCDQTGCLVYHCEPVYSTTDYYEIETVNEKTMLRYDCNGIIGETCIKETIISKRKRDVNKVVIESMKTNDWYKVEEIDWISITNYINNWRTTSDIYNSQVLGSNFYSFLVTNSIRITNAFLYIKE